MNFIIRFIVNFLIEYITWGIGLIIICLIPYIILKNHRNRIIKIILYTDLAIAGIKALSDAIKYK